MKLMILASAKEDVYRDIVRVPEQYRIDENGAVVPEGSVCKLTVAGRAAYAIVRGYTESTEPSIRMDERLRNLLSVTKGAEIEVQFELAGLWGEFLWALNASDLAYRVVAKMAVLSVVLGLFGLVLGVVGLIIGILSLVGSR
jgi:hypothetical protein